MAEGEYLKTWKNADWFMKIGQAFNGYSGARLLTPLPGAATMTTRIGNDWQNMQTTVAAPAAQPEAPSTTTGAAGYQYATSYSSNDQQLQDQQQQQQGQQFGEEQIAASDRITRKMMGFKEARDKRDLQMPEDMRSGAPLELMLALHDAKTGSTSSRYVFRHCCFAFWCDDNILMDEFFLMTVDKQFVQTTKCVVTLPLNHPGRHDDGRGGTSGGATGGTGLLGMASFGTLGGMGGMGGMGGARKDDEKGHPASGLLAANEPPACRRMKDFTALPPAKAGFLRAGVIESGRHTITDARVKWVSISEVAEGGPPANLLVQFNIKGISNPFNAFSEIVSRQGIDGIGAGAGSGKHAALLSNKSSDVPIYQRDGLVYYATEMILGSMCYASSRDGRQASTDARRLLWGKEDQGPRSALFSVKIHTPFFITMMYHLCQWMREFEEHAIDDTSKAQLNAVMPAELRAKVAEFGRRCHSKAAMFGSTHLDDNYIGRLMEIMRPKSGTFNATTLIEDSPRGIHPWIVESTGEHYAVPRPFFEFAMAKYDEIYKGMSLVDPGDISVTMAPAASSLRLMAPAKDYQCEAEIETSSVRPMIYYVDTNITSFMLGDEVANDANGYGYA
jgi:hypothetical protein